MLGASDFSDSFGGYLEILKEKLTGNKGMKTMKILPLAYSNVGKTFMIGSLFTLAHNPGSNGFSVRPKNYTERSVAQAVFDDVRTGKPIPSNMKIHDIDLLLKQGPDTALEIELKDIVGQGIAAGLDADAAKRIQREVRGSDAVLLVVNAPGAQSDKDRADFGSPAQQLAQLFNFIDDTIKGRDDIPVVLVINKIDAMPGAESLKKKFEQERQEIEAQHSTRQERKNALKNKLGAKVNAHVAKLIERNDELHDLIDLFYRYLKGSQVPKRVFLCTSTGFGYEEGKSALNPYGTCAAFLWAVYARLKSQQPSTPNSLLPNVADSLLPDIIELYTSGQAYFNDDSQDEIWHLRLLNRLHSNESWG